MPNTMESGKKYCAICAWRATCQKKFSVSTDAAGRVQCNEYTRDLTIKDQEIDNAVKKYKI